MTAIIKMVVFDMAGTTVNEENIVYKTLHQAINTAGYEISLNDVLAVGAGMEKLQAIRSILHTYLGVNDDQVAGNIFQDFSERLDEAYRNNNMLPQPDALAAFKALQQKGVLIVLNTGYSERVAQHIIDKLGWQEGVTFDRLITASDVKNGRPSPDMINLAAQLYNISTAEIVKVGDSVIDIQEGKNAGCALSIGITTGAHTPAQLQSAQPDYIINNLLELLPLV